MRWDVYRLLGPLHQLKWSALVRVLALVSLVTTMAGCSGFRLPSERAVYKQACEAIEKHPEFPPTAKLYPIEKSSLYVGKNAARIDIPYDVGEAARAASCHVLLKRVARRWEVQAVTVKAVHPASDPA